MKIAKCTKSEVIPKVILPVLEGIVEFAEAREANIDGFGTTLRLAGEERPFFIRGTQVIEIGTKIRLHYEEFNFPTTPVCAYEIVRGGNVVFRYHARSFAFVDEK